MAASETSVEFSTFRSTLSRGIYTAKEYDRIFRIRWDSEDIALPLPPALWRPAAFSAKNMVLPREFAYRLSDFAFTRFVQPHEAPPDHSNTERIDCREVRNCYSFAAHMGGLVVKNYIHARWTLEGLPWSPQPQWRPSPYSLNVIAHPSHPIEGEAGYYYESSHAYVCLQPGETPETTTCVQLPATGGPMGITTLADIVATQRDEITGIPSRYFIDGETPSPQDIQPYEVYPPGTWACLNRRGGRPSLS
jgi:hypothetical protein